MTEGASGLAGDGFSTTTCGVLELVGDESHVEVVVGWDSLVVGEGTWEVFAFGSVERGTALGHLDRFEGSVRCRELGHCLLFRVELVIPSGVRSL